MKNTSFALQILTMGSSEEVEVEVVDRVIAYIKSKTDQYEVSPFETCVEGTYEEVMPILTGALDYARQQYPDIYATIKVHFKTEEEVLTIAGKTEKHR